MSFDWVTSETREFMSRGYLLEGETVEGRCRDIADALDKYLPGTGEKFHEYLSRGFYSLASPIWANFGRDRGLPASCNGSFVPDTIEGIMTKAAEIGVMTKHGAGTSAYLGAIRPRGTPISTGGTADGPVHFASIFETTIDVISQGNVRRGNMAVYLDVEHPDIMEFLEMREEGSPVQKLSMGVCITDAWMQSMIDGDADKRKVWARIIKKRFETGYPYIFWTDTVNRGGPDVYRDKGMKIRASNLCVSGDTTVLTSLGHKPISSIVDTQVKVWNGHEWSEVLICQTGRNQKLVRITLSDGRSLDCTPYHKFYITPGYKSPSITIRASDLTCGDKLTKFEAPVIEGEFSLPLAYENGFFSGDGCETRHGDRIYLYGQKRKLREHFNLPGNWYQQDEQDREYLMAKGLKAKFFVPDARYQIADRLKWLAGLLDADGTVARNGTNESFQLGSINKDFLREVQDMLQTLGVAAKVTQNREAGSYPMPANDGTGALKVYECQTSYRLLVNSVDTQKLLALGLKTNRLVVNQRQPQRSAAQFVTVVSVEPLPGRHDTFCFNEPLRHMGVFNGVLTGQCSEIALASDEDHSFVCDLSSMNLLAYDDWKHTDAVQHLVYLLDAVMEEYIQKTMDMPYMEAAHRFAVEQRALGIGTLGWHSYLQSKMIPFESFEAMTLNNEVHYLIGQQALEASKTLASIKGEPPLLEGYGRRNVTLTAIAPTTSSSFILGQVSPSIEPLVSNYFTKNLAKGKYTYRNPYLKEVLHGHGLDIEDVWEDILDRQGSVQHLDFLTDHEKAVFKTFSEISQLVVVQQAAQRQQWVDQGQSLNLMIDPNASLKEVNELMIEAWKLGVKTLYYQRGANPVHALTKSLMTCVACEA